VRTQPVGGLFVARHGELLIGGRDRTGLVRKVEAQMDAVGRVLENPGETSIAIQGALCVADVDGLPMLRSQNADGVMVDGPRRVARSVADELFA
jgi:hypothetical protein